MPNYTGYGEDITYAYFVLSVGVCMSSHFNPVSEHDKLNFIQSNPDSMKFRGPYLFFHIMRVSYYLGLTVNAQF